MRDDEATEARRGGGRRGRWETGHGHQHGPPGRGRRGRRGRWENVTPLSAEEARGWVSGRLPDDWFTGAPEVTVDRDEIVVVGTLDAPPLAEGAGEAEVRAAEVGRPHFRGRSALRPGRGLGSGQREHEKGVHQPGRARADEAAATRAARPRHPRRCRSRRLAERGSGLVRPARRRQPGRVAGPASAGPQRCRGGAGDRSRRVLSPRADRCSRPWRERPQTHEGRRGRVASSGPARLETRSYICWDRDAP